jgi:hypothetical protein
VIAVRDENQIALSVIVAVVGGPKFVRRCLGRLAPQAAGGHVEILVPCDSTADEVRRLAGDFPAVVFLEMGEVATDARRGTQAAVHEMYDRRIAAGLKHARGGVIALLQDRVVPDSDWCEQVLHAHRLPYGVIGGAVEHLPGTVLNWAVYFLDFGSYQLPLSEGLAGTVTDVNVSYKREALKSVSELWRERYQERAVNAALARRGVVSWLRPQIIVRQDCGKLLFSRVALERFCWGRLFGSLRARDAGFVRRFFYAFASPAVPLILVARAAVKVFRGRRNRAWFLGALPHFVAIASCRCAGELVGCLTGRESSA